MVVHYFWHNLDLPTCICTMMIVVGGRGPVDEVHTWEVQLKYHKISIPLPFKQYHVGQVEDL